VEAVTEGGAALPAFEEAEEWGLRDAYGAVWQYPTRVDAAGFLGDRDTLVRRTVLTGPWEEAADGT
jgi:hypothetical protein